MNYKKYVGVSLLSFALICLSLGLFIQTAHATVGGPTYVYDLKFDAKTNTIYYSEQNYGGKGCPPELKAIPLETQISQIIISCDSGLDASQQAQEAKMASFTAGLPSLVPLNLNKNNITVTLENLGPEKLTDTWTLKYNFIAHVSQNGEEKTKFPLSLCNPNESVNINGYPIPGIRDTIAIVVSGKSDCFEGGYIAESVHIVSDLHLLYLASPNTTKTNAALVPYEGTLIVSASKVPVASVKPVASATPAPTPATSITPVASTQITEDSYIKKENNFLMIIIALVLTLGLGILLGRTAKK